MYNEIKCDICGDMVGFGSIMDQASLDELSSMRQEPICRSCKKAIADAQSQLVYLKELEKDAK